MKKSIQILIASIALSLFSQQSEAQGVVFNDIPWAEALAKARKENKHVFVDVYTSWCGPCKKMASSVFTNPQVADYMNSNFVSIKIDAEKQKEHEAIKNNPPSAYPSYYYYNNEGNLLSIQTGFHEADEFVSISKKAMSDNIGKEYENAMLQWNMGNREPQFVKKLLFKYVAELTPDSLRPMINQYLQGLNPEECLLQENSDMIICFMRSIKDDWVWKTIVTFSNDYLKTYGEDFGRQLYMNLVRIPGIDKKKSASQYEEDMRCIEGFDYPNKEMFGKIRHMENVLASRNFTEALDLSLAIGEEYGDKHPYLFTNMFYSFIINEFFLDSYTPTSKEKELIMQLAQHAFSNTPSQCTVSYLAAAQARSGLFREAYNTLASLPFYNSPTLTTAVYSLLNLSRLR
ncbi:MAG: DUF255 domain-containing protein [Prevotellaceae bacterium]|nr:DUF255 domain-containing protein [Prevotellaceae bacterium]